MKETMLKKSRKIKALAALAPLIAAGGVHATVSSSRRRFANAGYANYTISNIKSDDAEHAKAPLHTVFENGVEQPQRNSIENALTISDTSSAQSSCSHSVAYGSDYLESVSTHTCSVSGDDLVNAKAAASELDALYESILVESGNQSQTEDTDVHRMSVTDVLILDQGVDGGETLLSGLDPNIMVLHISKDSNGVEALIDLLSSLKDIKRLHLVSHGANGQLNLGASSLSSANIEKYSDKLSALSRSFAKNASINLYGCSLAADESGIAFIDTLKDTLNVASISASDDITGPEYLGGDWELEHTSGDLIANVPFQETAMEQAKFTLASCTVNGTSFYHPFVNGGTGVSNRVGVHVGGTGARSVTFYTKSGAVTVYNATGVNRVYRTLTLNAAMNDSVCTAKGGGGAPEINLQGNGNTISSGDSSPSTTDDTDFGNIAVGSNDTHTFTVQNTGNADLTITSVVESCADFSVSSSLGVIAQSGSGTFTVTYTPSGVGSATNCPITINNDDADEGTYTFVVGGAGVDNDPPVVQSITESSADDATSVDFTVTFNENANNVSVDDFTITNVAGDATGTISGITTAVANTTYTVTVSSVSGEGTFRLDLLSNTNITDDAGNGNGTNGSVAAFTSATPQLVSFTSATTSATSFDTENGSNLSPSFSFDSTDETLTIGNASHTVGTANGDGGTDELVTVDTWDMSSVSVSNFETLTIPANTSLTMTSSQHELFTTFTDNASQSITISSGSDNITGDGAIEHFSLSASYSGTFTLGSAGQNITGADSAVDTINVGALTVTGNLDGGTGEDVLQLTAGANIAGASTLTGFETAQISGAVTMTETQHDGFTTAITASGGADQITISAANDGFNADADIETYVLGVANTITVGTATGNLGQNVTGSSGDDTVSLGSGIYTGTLNGVGGTGDTLSLVSGAGLAGATVSNFENLTLASGASVSLGASQFSSFSGSVSAPGNETISVSGDGDFTTLSNIENWVVGDDSSNSRTVALAANVTSISDSNTNDAVTFNVGTLNFTGSIVGEDANDTLQMGNGSSITGASIDATNVLNLIVDAGASVTMTESQHDGFTGTVTALGSNQITISSASDGFNASADIETYILGAANSVTLGTSGGSLTQNITGSGGNDSVILGSATYTGTLNGSGGAGDTLSVVNGSNIEGTTVSNIENLSLSSGATLTLSAADLSNFSGTITAPGAETLVVNGDANFSLLNTAVIENYTVGADNTDDARTITLGSSNNATNITASDGSDAITFSLPGITYTGALTGAGNNDVLALATGAELGAAASITDITTLSVTGTVTMTDVHYNGFTAGITAPGNSGTAESITISGDGDITVNDSDIESYTINDASDDARTVTLGISSSNNFTSTSTSDAITLDIDTFDYAGSFAANATVANTLISEGTNSISSAALTGFTNLTLNGATNDLSLLVAQLNSFSGTVTASGTDTLTIVDSGTVTGGNLSSIERFATGTGGSITVTISASDVDNKTLIATTPASDSFVVTGATGSQIITGSAGGDSLSGGDGADIINPGAGSDSMSGGSGNDTFAGSSSDLNGDTISDLAGGDTVKLTGVTGLTLSNARFNGSGTLQIDTDDTTFSSIEVSLSLSNSAGDNLNLLAVSDNGGDTDITFEQSNTLPVFSGLSISPPVAFTEDGSAITLDDNVTVFDAELDANSDNYTGSTLTISRNGGASVNDVFSAATASNLSSLNSGQLLYNGIDYGSVTNANGTLTLSFESNAPSAANIASIMQAVQYSNDSDAPVPSVTLNWVFNDGTADSNVTTSTQSLINITAVNDAPVLDNAVSPAITAIDEDSGDDVTNNSGTDVAAMVVDASITDPDGGAVEAIAVTAVNNTNGVWQYSTNNGTSWNNFSATTGGQANFESTSRLLDGTLSGASTHKIRFVPADNYDGTSTLTFRAWDKFTDTAGNTADASTNGGTSAFSTASDTASVTVNAINDDPVVDINNGIAVQNGSVVTIGSNVLSASDIEDTDATDIMYTVTAVPTGGALQKSNGSAFSDLSVNGTFTQQDIDDGLVRYVHAGGNDTADSFTFSVADTQSGSVTGQTFAISVTTNQAPVFTSTPVTGVAEGNVYSYAASASDPDTGDTLSFSLTTAPSWLSLNSSTGLLRGTPTENDVGSQTVVLVVTDSGGLTATQAFTITVSDVNAAPEISGNPATLVVENNAYSFTPTASDEDGDTLTFSISNAPSWSSFDTASGRLFGIPSNDDVGVTEGISISVTDGTDSASLPIFSITVEARDEAPTGENMQVELLEDESITITPTIESEGAQTLTLDIVTGVENGTLNRSGLGFFYQPDADFNGDDRFTYRVSDGEFTSDVYTVDINVISQNDAPVAEDDQFNFSENETGVYLLPVLDNDFDVDEDELTLLAANTEFGEAVIEGESLRLTVGENFAGTVNVGYSIDDGNDETATAMATVIIGEGVDGSSPLLTVPEDISVNATGIITEVNLGVATAVDPVTNNPIAVTVEREQLRFKPGRHNVVWSATGTNGNKTTGSQQIDVNPLISFSKDSSVKEGSQVEVQLLLNGQSPVYPVIIPLTVGGSAEINTDYTLSTTEVVIDRGRSATVVVDVLADGELEEETIVLGMGGDLNVGVKNTITLTVVSDNVTPEVNLSVHQDSETRLTVERAGGNVTIEASATDADTQDVLSYQWQSDEDVINISDNDATFVFTPADLETGVYSFSVTVSDSATIPLSDSDQVFINLVDSLQALGSEDSDGDLIPDNQEGYNDNDGDGIPDYLDAITDCNVVPEQVSNQNSFLVEGEPGSCLRRGAASITSESGGLQVTQESADGLLLEDENAENIGGLFDFYATSLPEPGQVFSIVFPQRLPVPIGAVFRKFRNGEWVDFVVDSENTVRSAIGAEGICPPPGAEQFTDGLIEGAWCVEVNIQDGGPNDDDGVANGAVLDPSGVAIPVNSNKAPLLQSDTVTLTFNTSVTIDVLENDSDPEGDALTVTNVSANFGRVEINTDNTLTYTPFIDYVGSDIINYVAVDGNGRSGMSQVNVSVIFNRAPIAVNDTASGFNTDVITIDVLANDTDEDGDTLTVTNARADEGDVVIAGDGTLRYTPKAEYKGTATITYTIGDGNGNTATGEVEVTVKGYDNVTVTNKASGGVLSWFTCWFLIVAASCRLKYRFSTKR